MMRRVKKLRHQEADLDITSFMNLMIVLVPVLLMSMVFSHITVLELKLPDIASATSQATVDDAKLELVIRDGFIDVNYPAGVRLKRIPAAGAADGDSGVAVETAEATADYDLQLLSQVLQQVKRQLREKDLDKRDIRILSQPHTSYQTLVSVMDVTRSFKAVVAASVVDAELFPDISLGDAPLLEDAADKVAQLGAAR